eukprot:Skav207398  [mRNA]  locus=scaffold2622:13629:16862:+ [translate_table: standard]
MSLQDGFMDYAFVLATLLVEAKITKEALLEQLREDEARKDAQEAAAWFWLAAAKAEQRRAAERLEEASGIQNRSWKRLSLALYNQFEHPEGTEVGGSDWEEVKEIYAEARAVAVEGAIESAMEWLAPCYFTCF